MNNFQIYYGKDTPHLKHTVKVVLTLVNHLRDKGYDLYIRIDFILVPVADEVTALGITLTGTVMSNKKVYHRK